MSNNKNLLRWGGLYSDINVVSCIDRWPAKSLQVSMHIGMRPNIQMMGKNE